MKKGFTLIELVVVMAIFSILLVGVMSLTGPVSKMMQSASLSEKTYSYAHNIQVYLQGKLEYADNLYVYTSDAVDSDGDGVVSARELRDVAENFRAGPIVTKDGHYANLVTHDIGSGASIKDNTHTTKGKIYIMRLANTGADAGQITLRTYDFLSDTEIPTATDPAEVPQLNDAVFHAKDAAYGISYALGSSTLINVDDPTGGNDTYRALDKDYNNQIHGANVQDMSISIVINKDSVRADGSHTGYVDVGSYRAFMNPVILQVANLPLTNINYRSKLTGSPFGVKRMLKDPVTNQLRLQSDNEAGAGFKIESSTDLIDFNNDIYFVFAYADELT